MNSKIITILLLNKEGGTQIRTGDRGFAIHCLTTWPYRLLDRFSNYYFIVSPYLYINLYLITFLEIAKIYNHEVLLQLVYVKLRIQIKKNLSPDLYNYLDIIDKL